MFLVKTKNRIKCKEKIYKPYPEIIVHSSRKTCIANPFSHILKNADINAWKIHMPCTGLQYMRMPVGHINKEQMNRICLLNSLTFHQTYLQDYHSWSCATNGLQIGTILFTLTTTHSPTVPLSQTALCTIKHACSTSPVSLP